MRLYLSVVTTALLATACGDAKTSGSAGTPLAVAAPESSSAASSAPDGTISSGVDSAPAAATPGLAGRSGELVNPDASTMVFLYYDLAGIAPPIDNWVEEDGRVKYAPGLDKASRRAAVRAELESAAAAVRGIGAIRLSMNANLSEYDPTYGEFSVRALAPSSMVSFDALGQKLSLKFGNGRAAQIWRVPEAEAQAIRDKVGYGGNVSLDALLTITAVQPGPGGGTITADVVEYEMRTTQNGLMVGRVRVVRQ